LGHFYRGYFQKTNQAIFGIKQKNLYFAGPKKFQFCKKGGQRKKIICFFHFIDGQSSFHGEIIMGKKKKKKWISFFPNLITPQI